MDAEVRERTVRLVMESKRGHDSQSATITSVAAKIGCTSETLRKRARRAIEAAEYATLEWVVWFKLASPAQADCMLSSTRAWVGVLCAPRPTRILESFFGQNVCLHATIN